MLIALAAKHDAFELFLVLTPPPVFAIFFAFIRAVIVVYKGHLFPVRESLSNSVTIAYLTLYYTVIETPIMPPSPVNVGTAIISLSSSDSRNRYLEQIEVLGKGDYQDYNIEYELGGNKIFQTFSDKDTVLYLYDENNSLLAVNDNSGYANNALLSYNFSANITYKLRLKFASSNTMGEVKLVGTNSDSATTYNSFYSLSSAPVSNIASFTPINKTDLYTYSSATIKTTKLSLKGTYNNHATGMYLYLIDPRSSIAIVSNGSLVAPNQYVVSASTAIIEKKLGAVPYLILVSRMNMAGSAFYQLTVV